MAEKSEKKGGIKIKINPWIIATLILLVILAVFLAYPSITGRVVSTNGAVKLSKEEAANKSIDYVNKYLLGGQGTATLVSVQEKNGLYNIKLSILGRQYDSYVSTDGTLFFPSGYDLTVTPETVTTQPQTFEPEKTDKPVAQLYVMSFCPYGQQAEAAMKPVVDLLGDKASIEPHFIVSISGETINSLHGEYEANEDMRQACIWDNYGQETFWTYVDYLNNNCNKNNLDTCWKDAANTAKVDVAKIEDCVETEGLTIMKTEEALAEQNSVTGSPTLIINGARYNGARTAEGYKQAICSAFKTQPSECSETLYETSGSASSGGCA